LPVDARDIVDALYEYILILIWFWRRKCQWVYSQVL